MLMKLHCDTSVVWGCVYKCVCVSERQKEIQTQTETERLQYCNLMLQYIIHFSQNNSSLSGQPEPQLFSCILCETGHVMTAALAHCIRVLGHFPQNNVSLQRRRFMSYSQPFLCAFFPVCTRISPGGPVSSHSPKHALMSTGHSILSKGVNGMCALQWICDLFRI